MGIKRPGDLFLQSFVLTIKVSVVSWYVFEKNEWFCSIVWHCLKTRQYVLMILMTLTQTCILFLMNRGVICI